MIYVDPYEGIADAAPITWREEFLSVVHERFPHLRRASVGAVLATLDSAAWEVDKRDRHWRRCEFMIDQRYEHDDARIAIVFAVVLGISPRLAIMTLARTRARAGTI